MTLAGTMWILPHMRAAVPHAIADKVKDVRDEVPENIDDYYVVVEFDRFVAPLKVRVWVIGFAGRTMGGSYSGGPAIVFCSLEREPDTDWPTKVRDLLELYRGSAVVVMDDSVGMGLLLFDPTLPLVKPDEFFIKTLAF